MRRSRFDELAGRSSDFASRGLFFGGCCLIIVLWLMSFAVIGDVNTWQLIINTVTTTITFLLVALLQNSQRRTEEALHEKLNAIADGLADLMTHEAREEMEERDSEESEQLEEDVRELRESVGLEERV